MRIALLFLIRNLRVNLDVTFTKLYGINMLPRSILFVIALHCIPASATTIFTTGANGAGLNSHNTNTGLTTVYSDFDFVGPLTYGIGSVYTVNRSNPVGATNTIHGLDLTTGVTSSYTSGLANGSGITYGDGMLFSSGANGAGLNSYNTNTGLTIVYSDFDFVGPLTYGIGTVYTVNRSNPAGATNTIHGLDLTTGVTSSYTSGLANGSGITYGDGMLFSSGANGAGLNSYNINTGLTTVYSDFDFVGPLAFADGSVYAVSSNTIYGWNLATKDVSTHLSGLANASGIATAASEVPISPVIYLIGSGLIGLVLTRGRNISHPIP